MHTTRKHVEDRHTGLHWAAVSGVQPIAYVARLNDRPVAILEFVPGSGFRLTTCSGDRLGDFSSAESAADALRQWMDLPERFTAPIPVPVAV